MHGLHLIADLTHCRPAEPALMTDPPTLAGLMRRCVHAAGLHEVGCSFHGFGPATEATAAGGVTGVVLLAESHVAVHTWPEHGAVTLDVYVCNVQADNSEAAQALLTALVRAFGAAAVDRREVARTDLRRVGIAHADAGDRPQRVGSAHPTR